MMKPLSERSTGMIDRVLAAETDNFRELVLAAGLSPGRDFRHALLRDVNFEGSDLEGFDFAGATFERCKFVNARIAGASFEEACFKDDGIAQALDWKHSPIAGVFSLSSGEFRYVISNKPKIYPPSLSAPGTALFRSNASLSVGNPPDLDRSAGSTPSASPQDRELDEPNYFDEALLKELRGATARHELSLMYQPKVHLRRQEIAGAEATIVWRHPSRGLILGRDVVSLAEAGGLIGRITIWVIEQIMQDQHALGRNGIDLFISLNLSAQLLSNQTFIENACALIGDHDVKVGFEITESAVIQNPISAIANLNVLANAGVAIAIDDYGAGLSSLAYLKQIPARELKIDKMFVGQLISSNRDPLIVRSTIDLAHALEMDVTAEGVETPAALALLSTMGCDMIQGYLISRPLYLDKLLSYLSTFDLDTTRLSFRRGTLRRVT